MSSCLSAIESVHVSKFVMCNVFQGTDFKADPLNLDSLPVERVCLVKKVAKEPVAVKEMVDRRARPVLAKFAVGKLSASAVEPTNRGRILRLTINSVRIN